MKLLIAIFSYSGDIEKGNNQAIRATWAKDILPDSGVDLKFLIGTAKPVPLTEEDPNWQSDYAKYTKMKPWMSLPPPPLRCRLEKDELSLNAPDGYMYLTHKVREAFRWALDRNFDYVFRCDTDTFVHVERLLKCGFEKFDYMGRGLGDPKISGYGYGGPGFFVSRRSCEILVNCPITIVADDVWVGEMLRQNGIFLQSDKRFCNHWRQAPKEELITCHLSIKSGKYTNKLMYDAYSHPLPNARFEPRGSEDYIEVIIGGRHIWVPRPKPKAKLPQLIKP